MNTFVQSLTTMNHIAAYDPSMTTTDNGAKTYASSLNHNVDLFQRIGSARGQNLNHQFDLAFAENPDLAIRMLLWVRDIRGGAGERQTFRTLLQYLETQEKYHQILLHVIAKTPEVGRFDDLLIFKTPEFKKVAYTLYAAALLDGNALAAKWAHREKSNRQEDRQIAKELMEFMKLTPKQYRKMLVNGTNVVESHMCSKQWDNINFQAVPSVATRRYSKAFSKNAGDAYMAYMKQVLEGKAKINASSIFPYDVTSVATQISTPIQIMVAEAQWNALPNYMNGKRVLPIIDTSSSMTSVVPGTKFSHMHMAITLGMYVAEKNEGAFKNVFLTFNSVPRMKTIPNGTLVSRYQAIKGAEWGGSTNFQASFDLILDHAIKNKVPQDEMPEIVVCQSDMMFNQAGNLTNYQLIRNKFEDSGYTMPKLVFWQMNGSNTSSPVRSTQQGVSLISGFSPAIMKAVLGDSEIEETAKTEVLKDTPEDTMKKALLVERYDWN
ncbi:MAG TPA: DUF2828 family protein [Methanosarcina sp.]|nr:DUF2828 family protein [Methanosarcina sp.]